MPINRGAEDGFDGHLKPVFMRTLKLLKCSVLHYYLIKIFNYKLIIIVKIIVQKMSYLHFTPFM